MKKEESVGLSFSWAQTKSLYQINQVVTFKDTVTP